MTRLYEFRKRLGRLRRRRQRVRWSTGYSGLVLAVLWILGAAFLVDWLLEMNQLQRLISLVLCLGIAAWAVRRYTLPWLGYRETDLDMALLVERAEHIDSDLIAAVQFESPEAPEWGSLQLENAVIEQAATTSKRLNVMRGLSRRKLHRRLMLLVATAAAWAAVGYWTTDHVTTFFNRFLLGSRHYPTRTIIETITVKTHRADPDTPVDWTTAEGQQVDPAAPGDALVRVLYGRLVRFEVKCSGELPEDGRAELTARRSGLQKALELEKLPDKPGVYAGELEQLREDVRYQLYFGDAWTDPGLLRVTQLPVVDVEFEVQPPPYAGAKATTEPTGLRQISVIEGSRVVVKLRSDKLLQRAALTVVDRSDSSRPCGFRHVEQAASEDLRDLWVLDSKDSPLFAVTELTRYEIDVTDEEDQHLEQPIKGVIRIQADSPPRIAAGIVTRYVLPTAVPTVYYRAIDDYGLARVSIAREVVHADGQTEEDEIVIHRLRPGGRPQKNLEPERGYPMDLSPMGLKKGDKLTITLRAVDYRGPREGKSASADPLVFQVTDEQGILASMVDADRKSAAQLKTMIQRQLGIGESPSN